MPRDIAPSAPEHHLGFWLRLLSNHVHRSFAQRLARHDVTVPQWVVLRRLMAAGETSITELAGVAGVDQGAMSRMVERLLARKLIERRADPADARARRLKLSAKGERLVPLLAKAADENERSLFGVLPRHERTELQRLVSKLVRTHHAPLHVDD